MPETMQKSSAVFKVGKPGEVDCQLLTRTAHVTHVESALEVFRDGRFRPKLVDDGSRLDTERVEVVFTSPFDWSHPWGSMFGNISFQIDWAKLVVGKNSYWLGAKKYSSQRPRILITDDDYSEYRPYLPGRRDGPWWRSKKTGKHYWNGLFGVEFLVEGGIPLHQVAQMKFVKGHPSRCLLKGPCPNAGHDKQAAAARLLAGACHMNLLPASRHLWVMEVVRPRQALLYAWEQLRGLIAGPKQKWHGPIKFGADNAKAHAWAAMSAFFHREKDHLRKLLRAFIGPKNAIRSCAALIEDGLELKEGTLPRD